MGNAGNSVTKKTNVRYVMLAMLFIVTTFNYVDRTTLSIAAPIISKDLGMDAVSMGLAFSAFGWAYTWFQIPGGLVLDKWGSRLVYGWGLLMWSIFTFLQGFSTGFLMLFVLRFLMGLFEAPAFPANSRIAAMWFPVQERGFATAIFSSAQYFALAAFTPLMAWILSSYGWPYVFYFSGLAGILIALIWFKVVRDPHEHKGVNQAELDHIRQGGGLADIGAQKTPVTWANVKVLITNRQMIGIYLAQFCVVTITWFFLTWFPTYLVTVKGMSILKVGIYAAIPAIAGFIGGVLGGTWSDWLLKRGHSLTFSRKFIIVLGLVMSSSIILCNYVESEIVVIAIMSLAFFSKGLGALGWCVVGDTSPKEMVALSGGIFNFCGQMASIATPIVIGYILYATNSFELALVYVGTLALLGALCYLFIVQDIERVVLPGNGNK
ncbi:MFS transporter [Sporomusa termitida]|uniref:Putative glucarate transporter n=1 Tax=Sporomusa termitida TaxID=2377 RepID=A0A517DW36_9FIRM|nr:MFS transporter [Sporomusa termitida]QDR81533.1 putative glucarate transporter [Sporomusa termitida]